MHPPDSKLPKPPHNPGLGKLVANLRQFHTAPDHDLAKRGFRGWHERGYVPHYDVPNLTQFVTFRLADSLPREAEARIQAIKDDRERRKAFESELDDGHGACFLRQPEIGSLVESALWFFHEKRYNLRAGCVMPNHVHVLVHVQGTPLSEILESWKSYTAREANRLLDRQGKPFWRPEYFDTYMRNADQESRTLQYIERNPCKAKLVLDPKEWSWSSARLRDEFGRLNLRTVQATDGPGARPCRPQKRSPTHAPQMNPNAPGNSKLSAPNMGARRPK